MSANIAKSTRRHDLDWLRMVAVLLLIIPFHSARVFDVLDPYYVKNAQTSEGLSWVVAFLNPWQLPLLFVLAGAAAWFALGHRTTGEYAVERYKRLLVPFVFGVLVIVPPQAYLALRFRGHAVPPRSFLADYWTIKGDLTGYTGNWTPGHLWFIGFLFVFSLAALPLFARLRPRSVKARWLLYAMPFVLLLANELPPRDGGSQNPWYSFSLFVAGFILTADHRTERAVHRAWKPLLLAAAATMVTFLVIQRSGAAKGWADNSLPDAAFSVLEAVNTWVCVLALLGTGRALLNLDSPVLRYTSEASFPVYLVHQTVIVGIAYVVVGWDMAVWPKFSVVMFSSFAVSLLLYELVIRRTDATRFLFGMRRSAAEARPVNRGLFIP